MKSALKFYLGIIFSLTILMITACGGGGGSGTTLIPLSVSMSVPVNNATNTSTTPIIQLAFSSAMNVQTITTTSVQLIGPNNTVISVGAFIPGSGNTLFTFAPNTTLTANTQYSVVVSTGATAANGLRLISAATFNFTTGSTATPIAQLTRPLATGITQAPVVEILFSKLMSIATINTTNIQLIGPNGSVPIGTIIPGVISGAINTINFAPLTPLAANTLYTVQLSSNIQDTSGISLGTTSFTLITGSTLTPSLQIVRPTDNSQSISLVNGIQVVFSEAMNTTTINSTNVQLLGPNNVVIPIGSIVAGASNTFTFAPVNPLTANTQYIVQFGTGIKDTAGNSLPLTLRYATTGTATTPVGVMINPVNNTTGVLRSQGLSLWFSETMNASTINGTTVQLKAVSAPSVIIPTLISGSGNSYTVTPASILTANTQYMLSFTTGVQDLNGNSMSNLSQVQYFTTGAN